MDADHQRTGKRTLDPCK
jgi:hypothetical protein